VLEFVAQVEALPFQMFFQRTKAWKSQGNMSGMLGEGQAAPNEELAPVRKMLISVFYRQIYRQNV